LKKFAKNSRLAAGLVSVRAVSSPSPGLSHNAVADMDFMFYKAGNVKKEYCFRGHPMLGYGSVRSWFVGVMPSRSYKRHVSDTWWNFVNMSIKTLTHWSANARLV